jgi:hypothetical protein
MRSDQLSAISFRLGTLGVCFAALYGLGGCAQPKNVAITTKPSSEELPKLPRVETVSEAAVAVEGRPSETGLRLVPDFKEPELTPEEKAALGPEQVHFKFLPYNELSLPLGSHVGSWLGGLSTATDNPSRVAGLYDAQRRIAGVIGWGGASTGVDYYASDVSGTYNERDTTGLAGPRSGIVVGTDRSSSRVAEREPHKTP